MIDTKELDLAVRRLVEKDHLPGVAVCVKGPEGTIFENGYGFRDPGMETPVDCDTMFGIASMSKSITSLALSILAHEGKLSWEDPVYRYFPEFSLPGAARDAVTLRHLAMHTAGIPPMEPLEWSIAMNSVNRDGEWIREMRRTAPNKMETIGKIIEYIAKSSYPSLGAPGEYMSYCNEGYAILSYVADQAAGVPLEAFCMERIFEPLGMARTVMDDDCASARALSGGNITSLFEMEDGVRKADDDWSILPPFRGCAMVKSSARDMAAYYRCLANGGIHEGKQVIPKEAAEMLMGPAFPETDQAVYCLGLYKRVKEGRVICEHSGGLHGVSTKGGFLKGEGYGFAVLCNQGDADMDGIMWVLYNAVMGLPLDTCHRWFLPAGRDFSDPQMVEGEYLGHEGMPARLRIRLENGKLTGETDKSKYTLRYCGGTRFLGYTNEMDDAPASRLEFFIRAGQAWGVRVGSRILQRI